MIMANLKPSELQTGHISNEEKELRKRAEEMLKGEALNNNKPPRELSANGKKLYKTIVKLLPNGFLTGVDTYTVGIVAEALDRMQMCQIKLNIDGLFSDEGEENQAVKTYDKYSKIFEKFSSKLGLSPKDRASLAVLNINAEDMANDEVLKALKGGGY